MYPKKYFAECREPIEKGSVFVLMPFETKFESTYKLIKQVLEDPEFSLQCYRSDEIYKPVPIIETILRGIATSQFIIADVSGRNPNVFYELGIAHTVKDHCIILAQNIEDVPFDLRHLHCIEYENSLSGADNLKHDLKKAVSSILEDDETLEIEKNKQKIIFPKMDRILINNAKLDGAKEQNLKLEVNITDKKDHRLLYPLRHSWRILGYELPNLEIQLHIDICNKESRKIDVLSIDGKLYGFNNIFLSWGDIKMILDKTRKEIVFPLIIDPGKSLSYDVSIECTPIGNNAQFAARLNKIDNKQLNKAVTIAIDTLDSSGNAESFGFEVDLDTKPIKELYISEWQTEGQLELLRLISKDEAGC